MEAAVTEAATVEREDLAEKASEFLLGVLERMGIPADIDIKDDKERTTLEIQTKDSELVIGRRGVVMDALQHLVNKVVYRDRSGDPRSPSSSMPVASATSRSSASERSARRWRRRRSRPRRSSSSSR
jgi:hypothetical protein